MALVPHRITALAESDADGTDGKNIVAGAVVSLFDANGNAATLYDDENLTNPSTSKQTDSQGQVVVWVTAGEYNEAINGGTMRTVTVGGRAITSYATTASLENSRPTQTGQRAENRERGNASYELSPSGYTAQPGDIVAANGRVWELQTLDDFRAYGDVSDSVDCGPLIEEVLNSGRSDIYKFRGNFTVDTPSQINGISNLTLDCDGAYFDCSNMYGDDNISDPDAIFRVMGAEYGSTTLTSGASEGDTLLVVANGSQIKEGDPIYIESGSEHWYTEGRSIARRFIALAQDVSGNNVTLSEPLPFGFSVSGHTVTVTSWDCISNINLKGGHFYGGNFRRIVSNGVGISVFFAKYFKHVNVSGGYINGFENVAVRVDSGVDARTSKMTIRGHSEDYSDTITDGVNAIFYGIFANRVNGWVMDDVTGYRVRHLNDCGSTFNFTISNCYGYSTHRPTYGSHSGCAFGAFINCNTYGSAGGVQWRGWSYIVENCDIQCIGWGDSNGIYDSLGGDDDLPSVVIYRDNTVRVDRSALVPKMHYRLFEISGGYYEGANASNAYPAIDLQSTNIDTVKISASFRNVKSGGICVRQSESSPTKLGMLRIYNCNISSDSNLIRAFTNKGFVWIDGNMIDNSASGNDILANNSPDNVKIENNFRYDGSAATVIS
jgi:hypothetical protein